MMRLIYVIYTATGPIVVVTYGLKVASGGRACAQTIVVRVSEGHIVAFS